ncbi:MAG: DUF151 domain-containing protein [Prevotellaceae bacterium]|jgi:bifunctional DNase/RNase|nr:DUF151 domain-containing protein [Prevotellaceae bacterium]
MSESSLVQVYIRKILIPYDKRNYRIVELAEMEGSSRIMRIMVGAIEANAIAIELDNFVSKNKLSFNNLLTDVLKTFNITLKKVIIYSVRDYAISSKMILLQEETKFEREIEVKISDALVLSAKFRRPIFVEKKIIDNCFIAQTADENTEVSLKSMTFGELKEKLDNAVNIEDYETAAEIRDEIKNRENELKTNN